jgi:uncharacterized protein YutE (UPF0331/DUF86 family)
MTSLNIEKVYAKFRDITESVARLKQFRDLPLEEFLQDQDKLDIASFRLIVATEAAIDICLHVAAKVLRKVPEEYAACFKMLGQSGLIDDALAARLSQMARFRNLLVHHYWKIDYERMYDLITGPDMDDLAELTRQVSKLAEEKAASDGR